MAIIITTGMTPFIPAASFAVPILHSLAMTTTMVAPLLASLLATTAAQIRLEWRPGQSGLLAATWTRVPAPRLDTSNAWNFSWPLTR